MEVSTILYHYLLFLWYEIFCLKRIGKGDTLHTAFFPLDHANVHDTIVVHGLLTIVLLPRGNKLWNQNFYSSFQWRTPKLLAIFLRVFMFKSFKTSVTPKTIVILQNLITTVIEKVARVNKRDRKVTKIVTTRIRYRVNGGWLHNKNSAIAKAKFSPSGVDNPTATHTTIF